MVVDIVAVGDLGGGRHRGRDLASHCLLGRQRVAELGSGFAVPLFKAGHDGQDPTDGG